MVLLLLPDVKSIFTPLTRCCYILHLIFSFLLIIWWVWRRVMLDILIVERSLSIFWIAVFITYPIEAYTAYLYPQSSILAKIHAFIYLCVPMFFQYKFFTGILTSLIAFDI